MTSRFAQAAEALIAAHDGGPLLKTMPVGSTPETVEEAYELQDAIMARLGAVGGWKVMAGGPPGDPLCSPLPADRYYESGDRIDAEKHRVFLVEVEVAVRLNRDFPKRDKPYTESELEAGIASLHPALEIISSPFVNREEISKLALLGDLQSNGAVVIGPALADWASLDPANLPAQLHFDGHEVESTAKGASFIDIVKALTWLANHAITRQKSLIAGNVVITGSRLLRKTPGTKLVSANLDGLGSVSVTLD